ncbi:MAG: hypothetical protein EOO15_04740 [Chitinophagaceae bacterium]|nr:MAG: hypothetical protein EOO15_04740 [Chitinophagaceae bacterium]
MKRVTTITLSLLAVAATAFLVGYLSRTRRVTRMRTAIAEEGYETAPDILYPDRRRHNDELYGPVLPN